jgi:hypothetical protein
MDEDLFSKQVQVERKLFSFTLKQNPRGRFLRITEDVGGRRDTVIIPSTGLHDIRAALELVMKADKDAGPAPPPLPPPAH